MDERARGPLGPSALDKPGNQEYFVRITPFGQLATVGFPVLRVADVSPRTPPNPAPAVCRTLSCATDRRSVSPDDIRRAAQASAADRPPPVRIGFDDRDGLLQLLLSPWTNRVSQNPS